MQLGGFRSSALALGLAGALGMLTVLPGLAANPTVVTVTPASLQVDGTHWYFYNDTNDAASTTEDPSHYRFVSGPGSPPAGVGSVFFHDDSGSPSPLQRWDINTSQYGGTALGSLTALRFNTYEPTGNTGGHAVFLNFDVNFSAGVPGYQGRLSYVPRQNGTVLDNTWQEWDTLSSTALWSWSHYNAGPDNNAGTPADNNRWPDGNTTALRTWADIVASFPHASINATPGSSQLVFRAGEPYPDGFTGYLDKVTVGVSGNTTVYDFEPTIGPPTDKDQCKNGGWQTFNSPTFKNQGDCVSYTNNGK
jgi:hypothetical protein